MPRQNAETVRSEGGDRVLSLGAVRVHHDHLQSGRAWSGGCPVCVEGLEGFMETVAPVPEKLEVAEDNGGDEEGDSSLSSGGWTSS